MPWWIDVAVPVYNEESTLARQVQCLVRYLHRSFPLPARVTIAENGSTDRTWTIAEELAGALPDVRAIRTGAKGRGAALKQAWLSSHAPVLAYTDLDLSTSLDALLPLVAPLVSGHSDVSVGSRSARGARVHRSGRRTLISYTYNLIVRALLGTGVGDAQCGFKAVTAEAAHQLVPEISNDQWFFDTELLVLARRRHLRVFEVPVKWIEDTDSKVKMVSTILDDLGGIVRLCRDRGPSLGHQAPVGVYQPTRAPETGS